MSGRLQQRPSGPGGSNKKASAGGKRGRETLEQQLKDDQFARPKERRAGQASKADQRAEKRAKKEDYVSKSLSRKILMQAREQQEEEWEDEEDQAQEEEGRSRNQGKRIEDDFDEDEEVEQDDIDEFEHLEEDIELGEEDERILNMFMNNEAPERASLADIIFDKIREKEANISSEQELEKRFDPKIVQAYKSVGKLLKTYTSGKIPKAFKIIPALTNWEEVLYFTNPDEWSAPAMYQATRLFASNLNSRMAQRFYNLILLPRVRNDFAEHKKLNFHLYMSLKKALFKPAAFYKGIILPLCAEKSCTLREAAILASVLTKVSIPVLHSAAALLKLSQMEYFGPNSLFIRVLLDKKYSLPYKVIDSLVEHFMRFATDERQLPVLWHQALLCFVQRYKEDLSPLHRESLKVLLRNQTHPSITEEIRRELVNSKPRVTSRMDQE